MLAINVQAPITPNGIRNCHNIIVNIFKPVPTFFPKVIKIEYKNDDKDDIAISVTSIALIILATIPNLANAIKNINIKYTPNATPPNMNDF